VRTDGQNYDSQDWFSNVLAANHICTSSSSSLSGVSLTGHSCLHELTPLGTFLRTLPRRVEAKIVLLEVELNRSKHVSTIGKKLVEQQYLLHMSSYYGELISLRVLPLNWPTNSLDQFTSFGHPLQILTGFVSWQRYCTAL